MGEAKKRKLKDPLYGKVPNRNLPRGIVITSPMEIEGRSLRISGSNLHPEELRFALLYWDKLAWPSQDIIGGSYTDDEIKLIDNGVIERPHFYVNGDVAEGMLNGCLSIFKEKSESSPGLWSLSEGERSLLAVVDRNNFDAVGGLSVRLVRSIPIPSVDMSIEQILKFKEKRRDELLALRSCLENTTQDVNFMGSPDEYLTYQINKMRDACSNLLRVSSEWQSPFYLSDLGLSMGDTFTGLAAAGLTFNKMLESTGSITGAMLSGTLAGAVSLSVTPRLRWIKKNLGPYKYVYKMHREFV